MIYPYALILYTALLGGMHMQILSSDAWQPNRQEIINVQKMIEIFKIKATKENGETQQTTLRTINEWEITLSSMHFRIPKF